MCYRPAGAGGPDGYDCPNCGEHVSMIGGVLLPNCPFCDAEIDFAALEAEYNAKAASAPSAAPAAPAPAAPAPAAPAAPKAPTA